MLAHKKAGVKTLPSGQIIKEFETTIKQIKLFKANPEGSNAGFSLREIPFPPPSPSNDPYIPI